MEYGSEYLLHLFSHLRTWLTSLIRSFFFSDDLIDGISFRRISTKLVTGNTCGMRWWGWYVSKCDMILSFPPRPLRAFWLHVCISLKLSWIQPLDSYMHLLFPTQKLDDFQDMLNIPRGNYGRNVKRVFGEVSHGILQFCISLPNYLPLLSPSIPVREQCLARYPRQAWKYRRGTGSQGPERWRTLEIHESTDADYVTLTVSSTSSSGVSRLERTVWAPSMSTDDGSNGAVGELEVDMEKGMHRRRSSLDA